MQFSWGVDEPVRKAFVDTVKDACLACGYTLLVINEFEHINPILDEIIAGIKASKFVIADFTYNNRGAYYESGFARGYGIPVIHTIKDGHDNHAKDKEKRLHFDIQQINYLKWNDPIILRGQLINRIKAVIDE